MLSKQNILVTGGAGFIGSHLCESLLKTGNRVFCLDNFCNFYDPAVKRANISNCISNPDFMLLEGDIRDLCFLQSVFSSAEFDTVIHLAAMAGVRPSIDNPRLYYDVNVTGTYNLLEKVVDSSILCRDRVPYCPNGHGTKRKKTTPNFIFASSSSVYGNNKKVPFSESDPVDNPISPYAVTKKAGELICYNFHHLYQLPVICLRFFTVYGPRQRPDLAIHKFARMILEGNTVPVFGDGTTKRDYTYIDDIIQGILKAVEYVKTSRIADETDGQTDAIYEIFNLGESRTIPLNDMIAAIEDVLNKKARRKVLPQQPGDVSQTYADITKSRKKLGYDPHYDFTDGVKLFAEWLRGQAPESKCLPTNSHTLASTNKHK